MYNIEQIIKTAVAVIFLALMFVIWYLNGQNVNLKKELATANITVTQYKDALEYQNQTINAQRADYEKKKAELPKQLEEVKTRYQVVYKEIESVKQDKTADCQTLINKLNDFTY